MEAPEGKIIGIDLGTTNSLVAFMEGSEPVIIPNTEGSHKTPSVVGFHDGNEIIVGEIARRQAPTNAHRTIVSVKRLMGITLQEIRETGESFPFKLTERNGRLMIDINGMGYLPEQISALILQKLKESAQNYLNEEIEQAIITVPAYFDDLQRQATIEAARLAGLDVLRLVNEPTAAAMAYGLDKTSEELVAVYDFGGGTFDISILEIDNNAFEVLVSNGDSHLGGNDLDNALVSWIVDEFYDEHQINLAEDPVTLYRLKEVAEKAKCELSTTTQSLISLPFVTYMDEKPIHLEKSITRDIFEDIISDYVEQTILCCETALKDARLNKEEISKVILVGGSSRIPMVREMVEDFFEISPFRGVNPDEIVALGAATQAGVFSGHLEEVVLLDVTPHSLGVEVKDGRSSVIIEKNSTIPIKAAKTFTTTEDNQTFVNIHVVQGESQNVDDNRSLGKFTLGGIEPARAGVPRIRITFFINADGVVEISAQDLASGSEKNLTITHSFLSTEERDRRSRRRKKRLVISGHRRSIGKGKRSGMLRGVHLTKDSQAVEEDDEDKRPAAEPDPRFSIVGEDISDIDEGKVAVSEDEPVKMKKQHIDKEPVPLKDNTKIKKRSRKKKAAPPPPPPPPESLIHDARTSAPLEKEEIKPEARKTEEDEIIEPVIKEPAEKPKKKKEHEAPAVIDPELIKQIKEKIKNEETSGDAQELYTQFCDQIAHLEEEEMDFPVSLYLLQSRIHILNRLPEAARNSILHYRKDPSSETEEILQAYDKLLNAFPHYILGIGERAKILAETGEIKRAMEEIQKLQNESGESLSDIQESVYELYLQHNKDAVAEFNLVKIYLKKNKLDEAINILQNLVKNKKYKKKALKILGLTYWQKNMHSLAWHTFNLLNMNEELADILYRLAMDIEKEGDLTIARDIYSKIVEDLPEFRDASVRLKKIEYRRDLKKQEEEESHVPALQNSRFEILEEVNRGSMGIIYRARDTVVSDTVGIKLLNDYLCQDPKAVERFKSEARAAKKLSHPYIVRIHDMFESGQRLFLSMEYIEGIDLKSMLNNDVNFSEETILQYFLQICDALAYAHSLGIIHRDIKPANIMITPFNTIKITDFGIAKILKTDAITKSGTAIIGTPLYMSPEQIIGERVDARTDIYSLGIMLYELVSGHPPFREGNIEYHHVHTPPKPIESDFSDALKSIIMKMIEKKREDRYQSVKDIFKAVKKLQDEGKNPDSEEE